MTNRHKRDGSTKGTAPSKATEDQIRDDYDNENGEKRRETPGEAGSAAAAVGVDIAKNRKR